MKVHGRFVSVLVVALSACYSVILIEHHIKVVMELCQTSRIFVLNLGEMLASGTPTEIQNDTKVINAYLGEKRSSNGRTRRQVSRNN